MQERRAFLVIFAIAGALIIPAAFTLRTVVHSVLLQATSNTTVIVYEAIKIWKALGTRTLEAFFGIRK